MANSSSPENNSLLLKKIDGVVWVRDSAGIVVINPDHANYSIFGGLEADLWDAIVLNRSLSDILLLIVSCLGGTQEEARNHLAVIFKKWSDQGFVSLEAESE
jgi:hypothetical protein